MQVMNASNWTKRTLNKGFVWQEYFISAANKITKKEFGELYKHSVHNMNFMRTRWEDHVHRYIMTRAEQLGMNVIKVMAYCQEEPNPKKPLEKIIWKTLDLAFVWSVWAYIEGPIKEELHRPGQQLPIEGFWPHKTPMLSASIAEIIDAEKILKIEQGDDSGTRD